ncbi:MAG TPA: DUF4342 domain-containing protein [Candidatus Limnocylindria bacterium]|nr:DUF4342 domain-containing protein [Candidatus Limnocylindria bacterium]
MNETSRTQEFSLNGDEVVAKVKELIHEGNIRRIIIKNEEGRTMLEVPLTIGVLGAALLPILAAIGAAAALATRCTLVVERDPNVAASGSSEAASGQGDEGTSTPSQPA